MNNNFLQAVRAGDLMAAKSAFNAEMSTRVASTLSAMKQEIANSVALPEVPVSMEADND
ncbi:prohead [Cronobacter phage S13]|jgi:hypothetical protein|uniref:Uncharacterized protein n=1 Tax=Cronobacter phage LPCS28 TaxID=2924885 RepID=A0AAE9G9Q2_9CAUD|nr:prohead [Cronobacter phage S13]YP_010665935.1 prohead [Cronobacter phage LPCS28]AIA64883.1 hypothetical protein S13_084 [Cronobacter phage S13]UNY47124.1 hypothetical protein EHEKIMEA_00242 [Cronobacter phage LPCS28]